MTVICARPAKHMALFLTSHFLKNKSTLNDEVRFVPPHL